MVNPVDKERKHIKDQNANTQGYSNHKKYKDKNRVCQLKGALDKYNIIPQLIPKKVEIFISCRSVSISNDCMLSFTF